MTTKPDNKSAIEEAISTAIKKIRAELESDYNQKKAQLEAKSNRKPWAAAGYSALAGFIIGLIVMYFVG